MVWTIEEQQQRVTTPLQKVATFVLGVHKQLAKNGVQEVAQLLGTFPTTARQSLGEWGEADDVEQQQAAVDDPVDGAQFSGRPRRQQPRYVGRKGRALPKRRQPGVAGAHWLTLNGNDPGE